MNSELLCLSINSSFHNKTIRYLWSLPTKDLVLGCNGNNMDPQCRGKKERKIKKEDMFLNPKSSPFVGCITSDSYLLHFSFVN